MKGKPLISNSFRRWTPHKNGHLEQGSEAQQQSSPQSGLCESHEHKEARLLKYEVKETVKCYEKEEEGGERGI